MGIFGPKGARLVFSCVSAVGATKFAPQADWDLQYSADALTAEEFEARRISPASSSLTPLGLSTPADEMKRRSKKNPNDIQVPIFYATNREPLSTADRQRHPRKFFGQMTKTTPGLNFGLGRVRIREDAFKLANLQDERDARRLEEIKPCENEAEWKKKLREALSGDVKKSIFVFVHGCFTDFPRGLEYGGLVKHGCNFSGPMIVFSWPSIGHKVQSRPYAKDEKTVKWSVPQLKEFLHMLLTEFEAKVHVLSYSMGARVVVGALDLLEEEMLAIDGKLKKEGGELRARVQERIRGVVTRSEEAAAGVKVGVRELGSVLARERDLLKERATQSMRISSIGYKPDTEGLDPGTESTSGRETCYTLGRCAGYGRGSDLTQGCVTGQIRRAASVGKISWGLAGQKVSPTDGSDDSEVEVDRDGVNERVSALAGDGDTGRGSGRISGRVSGGVSEERVQKWEALRSKLGHLIFMAPDEEVERFRHTARRWTRGLRERVSGDGNKVSGKTRGTAEAVKERVKSGLEAEGPEAVEEAAKRGERSILNDDVMLPVGSVPGDVMQGFADPSSQRNPSGNRTEDLLSYPPVANRANSMALERVSGCLGDVSSSRDGVSTDSSDVSNSGDDVSIPHADIMVTPELSAWHAVLGGDSARSGSANQPSCTNQPGSINQPASSNQPGFSSQPSSVNPPSALPPHLATIFSGKALAPNPKPSILAALPADSSRHRPIDSELQSMAHVRPSETQKPPLTRRHSATPVVSIPAPEETGRASLSPDDVIESAGNVGAFTSYPGPGNFRATSPASSSSSRSFSRSSSSTDLVGEELQQALLWEHLHASGSDACSDRSSDASSRASSRPLSRNPSVADLASNSSSIGESIATVEDLATVDPPNGTAPFRRRSLPALGLHLSTSAPILSPGSLEWRFLQSLPRPIGARQLSRAEAGGSLPYEASPSGSDERSELRPGEDCANDVTGPRFSLYTSQSDWALKLAGLATTKPWARGLARMVAFGEPGRHDLGTRIGATLVVEDGYETIDATEISIGSRNMGHHYLFHRCILEDITHLLSGANAHKRRFEAMTPDGQVYWKIERGDFKPSTQAIPALYPSWSAMILESAKVAPAEQQLARFASDSAAINSLF